MRLASDHIWNLWNSGGPFTGPDGKPHGRVTVEGGPQVSDHAHANAGWALQETMDVGLWPLKKSPLRYFQLADNSQIEVELPNVQSINIRRSLDTDANEATIVLINQRMDLDGEGHPEPARIGNNQLGSKGWLSFNRGDGIDGRARWGHKGGSSQAAGNEWRRRIMPGAMLRTYEGFGGHDKTIREAQLDGNLVLTGLWIIDEIQAGADTGLSITCRDPGALLIDQIMYPPLVPEGLYPLRYTHGTQPATDFIPIPGFDVVPIARNNYDDYSEIVRDILLWSGFYLAPTPNLLGVKKIGVPHVFGNIEQTGITAPAVLKEDFFDKLAPIEVIKKLRDVVGYIFTIDDEGAARFQSANIWRAGNFFEDGTWTPYTPYVDERVNLTGYSANTGRRNERRRWVYKGTFPDETDPQHRLPVGQAHRSTSYVENWVNPAQLSVPAPATFADLDTMANLATVYQWLARRNGQATCVANPGIQLDDQVRIWEEVTSDIFIHYVRGIDRTMDLISGDYTMTLTTRWMGGNANFHIDQNGQYKGLGWISPNPDPPPSMWAHQPRAQPGMVYPIPVPISPRAH